MVIYFLNICNEILNDTTTRNAINEESFHWAE